MCFWPENALTHTVCCLSVELFKPISCKWKGKPFRSNWLVLQTMKVITKYILCSVGRAIFNWLSLICVVLWKLLSWTPWVGLLAMSWNSRTVNLPSSFASSHGHLPGARRCPYAPFFTRVEVVSDLNSKDLETVHPFHYTSIDVGQYPHTSFLHFAFLISLLWEIHLNFLETLLMSWWVETSKMSSDGKYFRTRIGNHCWTYENLSFLKLTVSSFVFRIRLFSMPHWSHVLD